jgi:hypothetical protein
MWQFGEALSSEALLEDWAIADKIHAYSFWRRGVEGP